MEFEELVEKEVSRVMPVDQGMACRRNLENSPGLGPNQPKSSRATMNSLASRLIRFLRWSTGRLVEAFRNYLPEELGLCRLIPNLPLERLQDGKLRPYLVGAPW